MSSNIVKPETFDHLFLVYHFTVPLKWLLMLRILSTESAYDLAVLYWLLIIRLVIKNIMRLLS